MNFAWRIYRRLAQAFPHEFKLAYGTDVMQLGEDIVDEIAKRHGTAGLIRLIADIAVRVPIEYLSEMRGDMRYAWRALRRSPGFALVGIVSMALGIGLTTNVYSTKWAVLFRELPGAANAKRLVMMQASAYDDLAPVSYYYIEQFRKQKELFSGVAALEIGVPFNVALDRDGNAKPQRSLGQLVSPDYFSVLGMQPQRGRLLSAELEHPGDAPVVVISDRFWREHLNSSPDAVGKTIHLNGQPATIVGITPKDFRGALAAASPSDLFVPVTAPSSLAPELANDVLHQRNAKEFLELICLAPGVTMESAEAALDAITRRLDAEDPSLPPRIDQGRRVSLLGAGTRAPIPRTLKPALIGFLVALMGLIVALACTNLANLLIARAANRRKELAIRLSMGAGRFRIVRQMIAEGLSLSLLGGLAGFGFAYVLSVLNSHFSPSTTLATEPLGLDWHAAVFAFALALVCGIAFSLAPALQATKADLTPALKQGAALHLPGYRRIGFRNLLMVAQVAASLLLLLMTGFLVLGISHKSRLDTKFDPRSMLLFSLDPVRDGYTAEKAQALFENLPARLKADTAINGVALADQPPFSTDSLVEPVPMTAVDAAGSGKVVPLVARLSVGAGYFAALSERTLAGREFEEHDQRTSAEASTSAALPAVLNQTAKEKLFGNENAIGRHIRDDKGSYEVVGVVRDFTNVDGFKQATLYLPLTRRDFSRPPGGGITVMVRSDVLSDASSAIRKEFEALDPNLNLFHVQTLAAYLERSRAALQFSIQTYSAMGLFGLILAGIGLAGVTAYAVAQRSKEIGIRMALGARSWQVLALVLREGAALVGIGTILGFVGAIGLAKIVSALMHAFADTLEIGTGDPLLLIGAPTLLAVVALLACYVPARRATQVDPLLALRQE